MIFSLNYFIPHGLSGTTALLLGQNCMTNFHAMYDGS